MPLFYLVDEYNIVTITFPGPWSMIQIHRTLNLMEGSISVGLGLLINIEYVSKYGKHVLKSKN
jgi:hypothetical protein